jgi:hypothetical protein
MLALGGPLKRAASAKPMAAGAAVLTALTLFASPALAWRSEGDGAALLPPKAGAAQRLANRRIAASIAQLMEARYVLPEVGRRAAEALRTAARQGRYDALTSDDALASALASDLAKAAPDGHLTVFVDPQLAASIRRPAGPSAAARQAEASREADRARLSNHDVRRVEVLAGNVGYIELRGFAPTTPDLRRAYAAALNLVAETDAVIIDLRRNSGGHGGSAALLAGAFFAAPVHLMDHYERPTDTRTAVMTPADAPGRRRADVPLYVLTSTTTFSAAEAFTYGLRSHKRAVVVGTRSGGGAHPTEYKAITDTIILALPESRSEHPVTRENWQDVGITPDIPVDTNIALERAHAEALTALAKAAQPGPRRDFLLWDLEYVNAVAAPVPLAPETLQSLAGAYGPRTITYEPAPAGAPEAPGALFYQLEGRPRLPLLPAAASPTTMRFVVSEDDRVEFSVRARGAIEMRKFDRTGQSVTALRKP